MSSDGGLIHADEVSVVIAVLGGFIILFGLVSFFIKERLYLSDALVAAIVGIILSPAALNVLNPLQWGTRDNISHDFTRIVITIQVMCSGVALPRRYLIKEWKSLFILLVPVMVYMWIASGVIIYLLIPDLNLLEALAIAACITPTDPILANSVVKGRFAEKHVPPHVRNLLSAESATNDGLTYPFLYLSLYLLEGPSIGKFIGKWLLYSWLYQVVLSIVIGIVVGYIARKLLYLAESNRLIDKESFLVFAIALSLFLTGFVTIIGSNDFLASFVAGTSFTWDDWFRKETEEAHLQEVIDMLLNLAIFIYVGAVIPWSEFQEISIWRLIVCAILILIFRRVPAVLALLKFIPAMKTYREAAFIGWFGPIGIGAIYYVTVVRQYFGPDSEHKLVMAVEPVVYFLVMSSVLVHGVTIPLVKISKRINTRTLTGGTINNIHNQVSRLPVIRIGTEIMLRKEKTSTPPDEVGNTSSTTITIETQPEIPEVQMSESITTTAQHDEKRDRNEEEEIEEPHHLNFDIPQNLMKNLTRKSSGSLLSSKYAIWDEGDSYIIENYDGEDIHIIHNTSPQERQFFKNSGSIRSQSSQQGQKQKSRIGGFFNIGSPTSTPTNSSPHEREQITSPGPSGDSQSSQQEQKQKGRIGGFFNRGSPSTSTPPNSSPRELEQITSPGPNSSPHEREQTN